MVHSQNLQHKLQNRLGDDWTVALGMRYGKPSIEQALKQLKDCEQLVVFPLYPQYSSSTTSSSIDKVMEIVASNKLQAPPTIIRDFHQHPGLLMPKLLSFNLISNIMIICYSVTMAYQNAI